MSREWLQDLKAGDEVIVRGGNTKRLATIVKVTQKQIVLEHSRFNRLTGRQIGGDQWHSAWLEVVTDIVRAEVMLSASRRKVLSMVEGGWQRLTQSQCDTIIATMKGGA